MRIQTLLLSAAYSRASTLAAGPAAAAGVDGFFIEVHPNPPEALSDATTQLSYDEFDRLIGQLEAVSKTVREVTK